mmetsp:Transcript_24951/g.49860  ORF Transcript_24951/g.49860 Transcript_24951/m.49860 type:complete len:1483 (+) Transcript_24951:213-4661(+)
MNQGYGGGDDNYYSSNYGGEYYDESATNNEYYAEEYQEQQYSEEYHEGNYDGSENAAFNSDALFYSTKSPFVMHPNGHMDTTYGNYDTQGDPISALAVEKGDKSKQIPSLMYVASHSSQQGASDGARTNLGRARGKIRSNPTLSRGSRMTLLYGDDDDGAAENATGFYGNRDMYSSFVAHPESESRVLNSLHSVLFGGSDNASTWSMYNAQTAKPRPNHVYGPTFTPPAVAHNRALMHSHFTTQRPEEKYCMGITSILPFQTPYFGSGGRVLSISPHGVRVHTRGGMVMSDKQDLLSGMLCGELIGTSGSMFANVAGMSFPSKHVSSRDDSSGRVHCIDLQRDLKIVSSQTIIGGNDLCVTDMASDQMRSNLVVGVSDGTVRVLDGGRSNAEIAKLKGFPRGGGVSKVAVAENLICATGYTSLGLSSISSLPCPFPSSHVMIYDIRCLGRGGIPHMFAGSRGGPRFLNFLPDDCGIHAGKLLIGSGQTFGGFELISPLSNDVNGSTFFQPELSAGEAMTTVSIHDGELVIGTSCGRVLEYALGSYENTGYSQRRSRSKEPLDLPPFSPDPSELTIDPYLLCSTRSEIPPGWNVFDSYAMAVDPIVSEQNVRFHSRYVDGKVNSSSLGGPMSKKPLVAPPQRWLSKELQGMIIASADVGVGDGVGIVLPASNVAGLGDLLAGEDKIDTTKKPVPNPNKILSSKLFASCYDATADPRKRNLSYQSEKSGEEGHIEGEENGIPQRYRMTIRKVATFDYTRYNESGLWVGWDYAPTFSNSFTCAVISLLYFVGEIRSTALRLQLCGDEMTIPSSGLSVTAELGCLFHLIECLSSNGMIQPDIDDHKNTGQVKAYVPSNFIAAFTTLPEATNLALIDGVAGSAEQARRPESFYRFIVQYLDRELGLLTSEPGQSKGLVDSMQGINFVSIIEYATSKSKVSTSRAYTVDLAYDQRWSKKDATPNIRFGEVLRYSLCKDAPLRAWSDQTRSYESVIQRKIATSLPPLLSLSCSCAGKHADPLGLNIWQQEDKQNWLPEYIEVQIETDRSITVKELVTTDDGKEEWLVSQQKLPLPASILKSIKDEPSQNLPMKKSYRLEATISFVRSSGNSLDAGHHVLHVRVPVEHEIEALNKQLRQIEMCLEEKEQAPPDTKHISLVSRISPDTLKERQKHLHNQLSRQEEKRNSNDSSEWLLINGFVVTKVKPDDVRSFNAKFKEPSIVIFREVGEEKEEQLPQNSANLLSNCGGETSVQTSAMETKSISDGRHSGISSQELPGKGDLVAIDAEFVCVQAEQSNITYSGSKEIVSEARNALARLSIIDCRTNEVIVDDYVLPKEPVVDCLTRFSGIRESDLDPSTSPHHLVTPKEAYMKVRLLMERGCIFVGHGLSQDFRVINICIPPHQIIDTAVIYHQPNQRYISLRYLTNYVLGRDMQQEVHDSIEDSRAAYELYMKALILKNEKKFDEYLMMLYNHGHSTQFKLGVAEDSNF